MSWANQKERQHGKSFGMLSQHHREGHLAAQRGLPGKQDDVAMVVHMHNELANNIWPNKLEAFWDGLFENIVQLNVQGLMGDFNMSLFRATSELRSRGTEIDLGAWYPWESLERGTHE